MPLQHGESEGDDSVLCTMCRAWHADWSVCKVWDEQVFLSLESSLRGGPRFTRGWPSATRRANWKKNKYVTEQNATVVSQVPLQRGHLQILFNVLICDCRRHSVKCKKHPVCIRWSLVRTSPRLISSCHSCSNQLFLCRVWSSVCLLCLLLSNLQPPTVIRLKQTCRNTTPASRTPGAKHAGMVRHIRRAALWQLNGPVI